MTIQRMDHVGVVVDDLEAYCVRSSIPRRRSALSRRTHRGTRWAHYRGGPAPAVDWAPMDQWTPDEVDAHVQFMRNFAARLEETGEFVDTQALAPDGAFVRYDGEGRPPVTDGPFVETKDLIAGWYIIDVESWDRAVQLAGELSAAPGPGGKPISEWLEVRPFLADSPTVTE